MDATAMTGKNTRILEYAEAELSRAGPIEPVLDEIRRDGLPLVGSAAWLKPRTVRGAQSPVEQEPAHNKPSMGVSVRRRRFLRPPI
jgi:hypothetical protein